MTVQQAAHQIMEKVAPQLFELGCENFMLFTVMTDGEGQRARVVIGKPGTDPALVADIMPVIRVGVEWEKGAI